MRARIGALLVVVVVLGAWSAAVATARGVQYSVTYSGAGTLTSKLKSLTSPQCGDVTTVRDETTHFSWVTHYDLPLIISGRDGIQGVDTKAEAQQSPLASNESNITNTATGCKTGHSDCTGESDPQPGTKAKVEVPSAALRGRSHVKVQAVGGDVGFTGKGFSGTWDWASGSCAIQYNDAPLLVPQFDVPAQLEASFPVKVSTLESLRPGHYFKVRIDPGHYAPPDNSSCEASVGCLKNDMQWHGVVEFKRAG